LLAGVRGGSRGRLRLCGLLAFPVPLVIIVAAAVTEQRAGEPRDDVDGEAETGDEHRQGPGAGPRRTRRPVMARPGAQRPWAHHPAAEISWMRVREVWLHAVDLDVGAYMADLPAEVINALLDA
jgi:hypothetical protein